MQQNTLTNKEIYIQHFDMNKSKITLFSDVFSSLGKYQDLVRGSACDSDPIRH